jgi:hypothetical protein
MAKVKTNWVTGAIYAVVIIAVAALVIYFGLYNAMPETLMVYDDYNQEVVVPFTDDLYETSMSLMMVSVVFPAVAYLLMYGWYGSLAGKNPQHRNAIRRGQKGGTLAWVVPAVVLLVLQAVWALVSWGMVAFSLNLDTGLFKDSIMCRQYFLVYGIAVVVQLLLYVVGKLLFKPAIVQQA